VFNLPWYGRPEKASGTSTSADITGGQPCRLISVHIRGTTGTGRLNVHDSTAADNSIITLRVDAANDSNCFDFGPPGMRLANGLSIQVQGSGTKNWVVTYVKE